MITTTLRIDEEVYELICKLAQEEERSVNSQILYMLKKYIESLEKTSKNEIKCN